MADERIFHPRNAWGRIATALALARDGEAARARAALEAVRLHPALDDDLLELFHRHLEARIDPDTTLPCINGPAEFVANAEGLFRVPFRRLRADRHVPRPFPPDLALPELVGAGNDNLFLHQVAAALASRAGNRQSRVLVLAETPDASEGRRLLEALEAQENPGEMRVALFGAAAGAAPDVPTSRHPLSRIEAPLRSDRGRAFLSEALPGADLVLFLPGVHARLDRGAVRRAIHLARISDRVVQPLWPMGGGLRVPTPHAVRSTPHPFGDEAPWRHLSALGMAVPAALLRRTGGPDPRFASPLAALRELAFRCFNLGAYFAPLLVPCDAPPPEEVLSSGDAALLQALCPEARNRPGTGRFEVPKVSIYIPAFNAARFIEEAVASVLEQDYEDLEVCIHDDGSTDGTLEVLERSFAGEPRVRWQSGPNGGIGHASNLAVAMSRGLYVGQLDSDDRLKPGAVRALAECLDSHPAAACCYGSAERIDETGAHVRNEYSWPVFSREKMMITSIAHHFRMFRRAAWERTTGFRTDIPNAVDYDMFLKLSEVGPFHHIDRVLYQRRWHGRNTSFVHERSQTENTYRVQTEALRRQGLGRFWEVHLPNPDEPRRVSFRPIGAAARVFFYPNYDRANPYQSLLYRAASRRHEIVEADIDSALAALRQASGPQPIIFHLHWLNFLFRDVRSRGQARRNTHRFLAALRAFREAGGRLVWTVHNTVSHDAPYPELELELAQAIAELADVVHLHSAASLAEVRDAYHIAPEKVRISRHGHYIGVYPDDITPEHAREILDIDPDEDVILFIGQVRPYKGVGRLVSAFRKLLAERPRARLVIAGAMHDKVLRRVRPGLRRAERARILATDRFLDDAELQVFFRAADMAVFPYARILTSGSLLLALSFGLPSVVARVGMTAELLDGTDAGFAFDPDAPGALISALRAILARKDAGTLAAMSRAARELARAQQWPDVGEALYAGL